MGEVKSTIQEKIPEMKENLSHPMDTVKDFHPMTFIALGAGLGALSGAALPVSEKERKFVDHKFRSKIDQFTQEIQQALNESVVILKDEFLTELKNVDVGIFKGQDNLSDTIPTPGL